MAAVTLRVTIVMFLIASSVTAQGGPDLIIINGNVRTMDKANPRAEAIAVADGRIVGVGSTKTIAELAGASTTVLNAGGRLVLPGFNDSHAHFMAIGNTFSSIDLASADSAEKVLSKIRHYARFLPKGRWILGSKLGSYVEVTLPALSAASPYNPVFVYRGDARSALANSLARETAGLTTEAEPNSDVSGEELKAIQSVVPRDHVRDLPAIAETASNYAASLGVTSVQDTHSDDIAVVLRAVFQSGRLRTRVYDCVSLSNWAKFAAVGAKAAEGNAMIRTGCVKGFFDTEDPDNASLAKNIAGADSAGLQVLVHAIGKEANTTVLMAFERAATANGKRDRRFRVEHAHDLRPADVLRFGRGKIIPSLQPILFFSEGTGTTDDYRRMLDTGAPIALGADAPMRSFNPLDGIYAAVNAGGKRGIGVDEAVYSYTMGSAFAEFQEKEKGSIEVGKLADLVMLSTDIFAEKADIRAATVVMTFVNGRIVYQNIN